MLSIKCPNCGAVMRIEEGTVLRWCKFCDSPLELDKEMLEAVRRNREQQDKLIDHQIEMERAEHEQKLSQKETMSYLKLLIGIFVVLLLFIFFGLALGRGAFNWLFNLFSHR